MSINDKFAVDPGWQVLLKDLGLDISTVLKRAQLPRDLFAQKQATLSTEQYFRLWDSLATSMDSDLAPLQIAQAVTPEAFSPPLFAALCSPDLLAALHRLSEFKRLIGPMRLPLRTTPGGLAVTIEVINASQPMPPSLVAMELVFLVNLARRATRENITPLTVTATTELSAPYHAYFGVDARLGEHNMLQFSHADLQRPFLTENVAMWKAFEPDLRRRLHELDNEAPFSQRVRSTLLELLPSGGSSVDQVASQLAVSRRTLQRRLREEDTSFQAVLQSVRSRLARHYLQQDTISGIEIALLLGFDSQSAFIRAFNQWTGTTPEQYRKRGQCVA